MGEKTKAQLRIEAFNRTRFSQFEETPGYLREEQFNAINSINIEEEVPTKSRARIPGTELIPEEEMCGWRPIGPAPVAPGSKGVDPSNSGRIRTLAISKSNLHRNLLAGSAGGGIWLSRNEGKNWSPKTDFKKSLAFGHIAVDPNNPFILIAGSGEYYPGKTSIGYAGCGIFKSIDGGYTWKNYASTTFGQALISKICFMPSNSQEVFLSCDKGVYRSTDGGVNWRILKSGSASDLLIIPGTSSGQVLRLVAGFFKDGIYECKFENGQWSKNWLEIRNNVIPSSHGRIVFSQMSSKPQAFYALIGSFNSKDVETLLYTGNGGQTWFSRTFNDKFNNRIRAQATDYNLVVAVHPTNEDIVFIGFQELFMTVDGGILWERLSFDKNKKKRIHADIHAILIDPDTPDIVYLGTDGGIYKSLDLGENWIHLNTDLSLTQHYAFSPHPHHAAIALTGAQDNGAFFYIGSPVWTRYHDRSDGLMVGDIVNVAFDPHEPSRMFYSRPEQIYRSEDYGKTWQENQKINYDLWLFPFLAHSKVKNLFFYGVEQLFCSIDKGDNWAPITVNIGIGITAICEDPHDTRMIYIGTFEGDVFSIYRVGSSWKQSNVRLRKITFNLPTFRAVSSLTVDDSGTIWVSYSSIEDARGHADFIPNHVYRKPYGYPSNWLRSSNGLPPSVPINTIVADLDSNRVFCGGDMGVYEWIRYKWHPWHPDLPLSPVYQLSIHEPSRLIRAVTFGRGVWERSLEEKKCKRVHLYIRDNILDVGEKTKSKNTDHPFVDGVKVQFWQSEDIKIESHSFSTPKPVDSPVEFLTKVRDENIKGGSKYRVYTQVHNRGAISVSGVKVRAYYALNVSSPPSLRGIWDQGGPFGQNRVQKWKPIGQSIELCEDLEAGKSAVVHWEWELKDSIKSANILVFTSCNEQALSRGIINVSDLIAHDEKVAMKSYKDLGFFSLSQPGEILHEPLRSDVQFIELYNPLDEESIFDLQIDWGNLPAEATILLAADHSVAFADSDDFIEHVDPFWEMPEESERLFQFHEFDEERTLEFAPHTAKIPVRDESNTSKIEGVWIFPDQPAYLGFILKIPAEVEVADYQFDLLLYHGEKLIGGTTYSSLKNQVLSL